MPISKPAKLFLLAGCSLAGLSVLLGAFAAHGLASSLSPALLGAFKTGVQYQMYHALGLLLIGLLLLHFRRATLLLVAGVLLLLGVVLFSGSLYALALGGPRWLGPVTPIGGLAFILGWLLALVGIARLPAA